MALHVNTAKSESNCGSCALPCMAVSKMRLVGKDLSIVALVLHGNWPPEVGTTRGFILKASWDMEAVHALSSSSSVSVPCAAAEKVGFALENRGRPLLDCSPNEFSILLSSIETAFLSSCPPSPCLCVCVCCQVDLRSLRSAKEIDRPGTPACFLETNESPAADWHIIGLLRPWCSQHTVVEQLKVKCLTAITATTRIFPCLFYLVPLDNNVSTQTLFYWQAGGRQQESGRRRLFSYCWFFFNLVTTRMTQ